MWKTIRQYYRFTPCMQKEQKKSDFYYRKIQKAIPTKSSHNINPYAIPAGDSREIDLLELLNVLFIARKWIVSVIFLFAFIGILLSFFLPEKWTSKAVITPAEEIQWNSLRQAMVTLQILNVEAQITSSDIFYLFVKKFQSESLLEEYLRNTHYVTAQLSLTGADYNALHREVVTISERMKAYANITKSPYTSWTLSFTAPTANDAQNVLKGYINFITSIIEKETMENIRNQIILQTKMVEKQLELDRIRLSNDHYIKIKRLNYSLEVANAAGIKRPIYSSGESVKDDPDYSVALGSDGIAQKLRIEKNIKDISELNADVQNREYCLGLLKKISLDDVNFELFRYQLEPSLPVKQDGPHRVLIVVLASLLGILYACGSVFFREATHGRNR